VGYNLDMRLAVFLLLFLLTPLFSISADDTSDNVCIFAVPKALVTLPDISLEKVVEVSQTYFKDNALKLVKAVPDKVDELADGLADKLESTKNTPQVRLAETGAENPQVLGTSSDSAKSNKGDKSNLTASAYNAGVDVLSLLLRNWMWTLSGLAVLALFWTFKH